MRLTILVNLVYCDISGGEPLHIALRLYSIHVGNAC